MTIKKKGSQYCAVTSRSEECFPTKGEAEERLRQIEFFKSRNMAEYKDDEKRMAEEIIMDKFRKSVISFGDACEKYGQDDPRCKRQKQLV